MALTIGIGRLKISRGAGGSSGPNGAPSGLVLITINATTLQVAFSSTSTTQDGYKAYISSDGGSTYPTSQTNVATTFNLTGLTSGVDYYVYVVAYKGNKESDPTNITHCYTASQLGTLLLDEFDSLSDSWITTGIGGGGSLAVAGGKLTYTRVGANDFGSYVYYNGLGATLLANWEMEYIMKIPANSTTTTGIGAGVHSDPSDVTTPHILFAGITTSTLNRGKLYIWDHSLHSYASATNLTLNTNDRVRIRVNKTNNVITVYAKNLTTDEAELSHSHTWVMDDAVEAMATVGYPHIQNLGTVHEIEYFKWSSIALKNVDIALLGDSHTVGYEASVIANSWSNMLKANSSKAITILAAQGCLCEQALWAIGEIGRILPKRIVIMLGTNNVLKLQSFATMEGHFSDLLNAIVALGITPIICRIPPNTTNNGVITYNDWLTTTYGGTYTVIDTWTPLIGVSPNWNAAYVATGNIHMNDAGHTVAYNTIIAAVPSLL